MSTKTDLEAFAAQCRAAMLDGQPRPSLPEALDANLKDANLSGANLKDADLWGANLRGARFSEIIPVIPKIDAAILAAIETGGNLAMNKWHTCETTHCRAGWAITLAGEAGKALEERTTSFLAGALIYRDSRPGEPYPDFFAKDEDAMADIRACAARQMAEAP